jgi:serine/threonine protein kinase
MYQVLCAVIGCHACGVLHLDLKPSNILISELNRHVFVSDFGTSRLAEAREISSGTLVGTRYFVAPELLRGERARKRSDCFSWGMCLLAALGGEPLQWSDRLKGPCRIEIERRLAVLPTGFVSLVPFVVAALSSDPIARPRLGEIERAMREIPGVSVRSTAHSTVPREGSLLEDIRSLAQKLAEMFG